MSAHTWKQSKSTCRFLNKTPSPWNERDGLEEPRFPKTAPRASGGPNMTQAPQFSKGTKEAQGQKVNPDAPPEEHSIFKLVAGLYRNPDFSDLMITCGSASFAAHKVILCSRSSFFRDACSDNSQVVSMISMEGKVPVLIEKVLQFLYTDDYTLPELVPGDTPEPVRNTPITMQPSDTNASSDPSASSHPSDRPQQTELPASQTAPAITSWDSPYFHLRMYGEADYFNIEALRQRALKYFRASFLKNTDNLSFAAIIKELYSERADYRPLRGIAVKAIVDNLSTLSRDGNPFLGRELLQLVPGFTVDLCLETVPLAKSANSNSRAGLSSSSFGTQPGRNNSYW